MFYILGKMSRKRSLMPDVYKNKKRIYAPSKAEDTNSHFSEDDAIGK